MSDFLKSLLIVACLGALSSTAFAQTATTEGETATEEPAAEPEAPAAEAEAEAPASEDATEADTGERADGLSTGSEVGPQVGEAYQVSTHGDWELRCINAGVDADGNKVKDPCQLYQALKDQNDNSVAEINLFNLQGDSKLAAGATIVTPLETLLTRQVAVAVDGGKAKVYPFTFCTQIGCFARVGFTSGDIAAFKRGKEAKIVIVPAQAPDQNVILTMSLTGFTDGFNAVTEATKVEQ